MNSRDRRKITQEIGARVELEGKRGTVTGHYDDDIVFVQLDGEDETERTWVAALTLATM